MLFNSYAYALFLPMVFCLYWLLPNKYRWTLLLVSSYYFYMSWNLEYVILILFTTIVSYTSAIMLEKTDNQWKKKCILYGCGISCLAVLFFFKYFNFISKSVVDLASLIAIKLNPLTLNVLLPVGISFYTFQTLSYVIDVYKDEVKAEKHFGYYATFISFFPQLVAGPIERTRNLLPQIKGGHSFNYLQATYGLKLMTWGFFKKLVIADNISPYVQIVYTNPQSYHGFTLILATLFFTIQIYCDFSGYSDIAIGSAKLLGIDLMTNFKNPYYSHSIKEFWGRWHISLSTWFRDYLYIPMGGNRVGVLRHYFNILITFLVSGLWHGANWTFVIWGAVHGLGQIVENLLDKVLPKYNNKYLLKVKVFIVFCFCAFAWIFFVSKSLNDAIYVITHLFEGIGKTKLYFKDGLDALRLPTHDRTVYIVAFILLFIHDYYDASYDVIERISSKGIYIRWTVYIAMLILIAVFCQKGVAAEFVYFQF